MTATAADNVQQISVSTGQGDFTLTALNGRRSFSSAFGTGSTPDVFYYFISSAAAAEWEVGTGHMSATSTLVRDTVLSSSNANAKVNFSAGTKYVCNDLPASVQNTSPAFAGYTPIDEDNFASDSDTALPTQQSVKAYVDNSISAARTKLLTSTTIHCNFLTGDDANDGYSPSSPKKTVQDALYQVSRSIDFNPSISSLPVIAIQMHADDPSGVHYGPLGLVGAVSGGDVTIDGGGFKLSKSDDSDSAIHLFFGAMLYIQNIIIEAGSNHGGLTMEMGAKLIQKAGVQYAAARGASAQIQLLGNSVFEVDTDYDILGGASVHMLVYDGAVFRVAAASVINFRADATFSSSFVEADSMGLGNFVNATINLNGHTVTGKRWIASSNGLLISPTAAPDTFFPGTVAGTDDGHGEAI